VIVLFRPAGLRISNLPTFLFSFRYGRSHVPKETWSSICLQCFKRGKHPTHSGRKKSAVRRWREIMNEDQTGYEESGSRERRDPKRLWIALFAVLAAANLFLGWKVLTLSTGMEELARSTNAKMSGIREYALVSADMTKKSLEGLRQELQEIRTMATAESAKVRAAALKRAETIQKDLAVQQRANEERVAQMTRQLSEIQEAAAARMDNITTDVSNVRTEVQSAKSDLDQTIKELRSVRGDLGVQSGLIATNSRELAALKELGARNYYEFDLAKKNNRVRVGDVLVKLSKADPKRNKYSIELIADDKRVEKKDKTINEPVQFYVSGSRVPYELVVNEVQKDRIVGYLSTPKILTALR